MSQIPRKQPATQSMPATSAAPASTLHQPAVSPNPANGHQSPSTAAALGSNAPTGPNTGGMPSAVGPCLSGSDDGSLGEDTSASAPSRVLHVRHLPPDSTELQVAALGAPFGRVAHVMLLRQRNQAFLEMADEACATAAVNYYNYVSANVHGLPVYVQYSVHRELRISQTSESSTPPPHGGAEGKSEPTVLHIIFDNLVYHVTVDVLHHIFAKFGNVLRIITFTKNGQYQALIEFASCGESTSAKHNLDGQNIYDRCCAMRIEYSKLRTLTVRSNNERQRDYTRENESHAAAAAAAAQAAIAGGPGQPPMGGFPGVPGLLGQAPMMGPGDMPRHVVPYMSKQMMPQPMPPMVPMGPVPYPGMAPMMMGSPVLLVSNLDEHKISPNNLFILFGVYGDVQRVKVLFNKKDAALIQMSSAFQAHTAQSYLNKVPLFGKEMHITSSKHTHVSLPREGQEGAELTKDFAGSPLHRFKNGSHNFQNIFPPSPCLHLSNIPAEITEEYLTKAFSNAGGNVVGFRWLQLKDEEKYKDRRMGLIQLSTVEEAIQILVFLHNLQLGEKRYLRVSFAKSASLN